MSRIAIASIKRVALFLCLVPMIGSCSTEPPSMRARGMGHIIFDGASHDVTGVYFEGDTTEFELTSSVPYPSSSYGDITVLVIDSAHAPYNFGAQGNSVLTFSISIPPFTFLSDSGSAFLTHFVGDTLEGSLSVRLRGSDSTTHRLSMSFVASSPFPID